MRLNITENDVPMEEFLEILDKGENLQAVYLLCHQCGCPVYAARNNEDKVIVCWHPNKDMAKNVIAPHLIEGKLKFDVAGEDSWGSLEELRKSLLVRSLLGDQPFEEAYRVWPRKAEEKNETGTL